MTENWTPGPWIADPDRRKGYEWNWHIVQESNPNMRVAFLANFEPRLSVAESTARLIAAAPELYKTTKLLSAFAKDATTLDYNEDKTLSWITFVVSQADAALAKARGES